MKKFILLSFFTLALALSTSAQNRRFTVVIDAGHGGHDAGACGAISKEKDLTLKYALQLGRLIEQECPDVKVIYTRKKDVYLELWQRAEIANRQKADLFLSIHINSLPVGRIARGYQTYTLGKGESGKGIIKNLEVAKRENSVIFMEKDYKQNYQGFDPNSAESNIMFEFIQDTNMEHSVDLAKLMQKHVCQATGRKDMGAHQANLAVLRLTSMPACLLELGFISTPDEEQFLNSQEALQNFTIGIFNAFTAYRNKYDHNIVVPYKPKAPEPSKVKGIVPEEYKTKPKPQAKPTEPKPEVKPEPAPGTPEPATPAADEIVFKVQIMASSKAIPLTDSRLKGHKDVQNYQDGAFYKYTIGQTTDYNEIVAQRKQLLADFPEAFIIAFKNGQRIDINQAIKESKNKK